MNFDCSIRYRIENRKVFYGNSSVFVFQRLFCTIDVMSIRK
ncbi:hypothetical protein FACS1894147_12400 [Spirochaetia bacterium]|nr:hypothetical protein FACS1894147_12400 [Spirochaetia bacterium]